MSGADFAGRSKDRARIKAFMEAHGYEALASPA
jgi:hypothetical protein